MPAYIWVMLHIGLAVWSVFHALLYKRDPRSAMGWIMACVFIPYAGPIAYYLFGINRVRSRARGLRRKLFFVGYEYRENTTRVMPTYADRLRAAGHRVTGQALATGNEVHALFNGDAAYPEMLEAIEQARSRVLLSTYILKHDKTGLAFATALEAAVARGVEVKVLVDGFGELYSWRRASAMLRKRKIETARFLPPRLLPPSIYINLRNHRKLLIIDDQVAYAGGMNISDDHIELPDRGRTVSDVHFALRGPVVAAIAELFYQDWNFANHATIAARREPPTAPVGDMDCRLVADGPNESLDQLALTIDSVLSAAMTSIDIMTPYFIPSRELMVSLMAAAVRGVRVRIVLPQKNNLFYVHWANRNMLAELLNWDIHIYYQPAPFCHSKLLCVDAHYNLIGSANLDPRSLRLNFEVGIEVFSEQLSSELRVHFDRTIAASKALSFAELANRSVAVRLRDSAAALFSPYL